MGRPLLIAVSLFVGGCAFGPKALERSHGCYNDSVRRVYEEQLLQNIVRLRYNEAPAMLDVGSIAAQYELSAQAEARPFFTSEATGNLFRSFTTVLPDVFVGGANRPTITLNPADDGSSIRQFLTPIPLDTLTLLLESGWPVSTTLRLWVERANGVPNAVKASGPPRDALPDFARFRRVAELSQQAQDQELFSIRPEDRFTPVSDPLPASALQGTAAVEAAKNGLEYRQAEDGKSWVLVRKERKLVLRINPGAEGAPEVVEARALLHLDPRMQTYDLVVSAGDVPDPDRYPRPPFPNLRLSPRSNAQVYFYLANGVEVPAAHLKAGVVQPVVDGEGNVFDQRQVTAGVFEVRACKGHKPPASAYVSIHYRGHWFYIDDSDQASKATLALVLQLSRLDFARQRPGGPLLTLPVGR